MKKRYANYHRFFGGIYIENPSVTYKQHQFLGIKWKTIEEVVLENPVITRFKRMRAYKEKGLNR